jgi:gamma-glutamyltranspeptidase / glutathione hydrolase / leukotriene-C4 hydrolase
MSAKSKLELAKFPSDPRLTIQIDDDERIDEGDHDGNDATSSYSDYSEGDNDNDDDDDDDDATEMLKKRRIEKRRREQEHIERTIAAMTKAKKKAPRCVRIGLWFFRYRYQWLALFLMLVALVLVAVYIPQQVSTGGENPDAVHRYADRQGAGFDSRQVPAAKSGNYSSAAVSCAVSKCSTMAKDVLAEGGSAVDAAVIAALCIGVMSPQSSGIGGGGVMLIRQASLNVQAERVSVIDCRETAPARANVSMFEAHPRLSTYGGLAVATPGELHCLRQAWQAYGALPWRRLVAPVAALASNFTVNEALAEAIEDKQIDILADPGLRSVFAPGGKLLRHGDSCHWPTLSATLSSVAEHGVHALYNGTMAAQLARDVQQAGGVLTAQDLAAYRAVEREPLETFFQGFSVLSVPPPFSGSVLAMALNIVEFYNLPLLGHSALASHWLAEAWKFAYDDRLALGDPAFVHNVTEIVALMLDKAHAASLRSRLLPYHTFEPNYYVDAVPLELPQRVHGTNHISVVDADRTAAAFTTTINLHFGSKLMSPSTGIILNNEVCSMSREFERSTLTKRCFFAAQ